MAHEQHPEKFHTNEQTTSAVQDFTDMRKEQVPPQAKPTTDSNGNKYLPTIKLEQDRPVTHESSYYGDARYVPVYSTAVYANTLFDTFDKDNNNHVTKAELDQYEKTYAKSIDSKERTVLNDLRSKIDTWQHLNHKYDGNAEGITWRDISKASKNEWNAAEADAMTQLVSKNFSNIDTNHDDRITPDEIKAYDKKGNHDQPVLNHRNLEDLAKVADYGTDAGMFSGLDWLWHKPVGLSRSDAMRVPWMRRQGQLDK